MNFETRARAAAEALRSATAVDAEAGLAELRRSHRRRSATPMAASAAVVAALIGGVTLVLDEPHRAAPPADQASPTVAPPRVAPSITAHLLRTAIWTTYTSAEYGFKVGHPADWKEIPATRGWSSDADDEDPASAAHDAFESPSGDVRVSLWNVPLDPGTNDGSIDLEAWVEGYCERSDNSPCAGIDDRAVELCHERRDCHPGLLVPFRNDVQAYFGGGDVMTVVAVWRGESAASVAPYGGAQRLLEAFLSTMAVWPASTPDEERTCYGHHARCPW